MSEVTQDVDLKAAAKGCVVKRPAHNELFIDIDTRADYDFFISQWKILCEHFHAENFTCAPSKSGGDRFHIIVTMRDGVTATERVLLQAVMGSDRKREILSYAALKKDPTSEPTIFFEKKPPVEFNVTSFVDYGNEYP